jgi:hypothetical protein
VNGVKGCCKNGRSCNGVKDEALVCSMTGYVRCPKESFCCPTSYECYRDDAGSPQCRSFRNSTGNGSTPAASLEAPGSSDASKNTLSLFSTALFLCWIAYVF